jgi:O-antigen/teichoic acid export membrane protein
VTPPKDDRYQSALTRGALFNLLGIIARLVQPLYVLAVTWLWGPSVTGIYLLAQSLVEIVFGGISAGYGDATTIFASRHVDHASADPSERRALYRVLSNTFAVTGVLAAVAAVATQLSARSLVGRFFPGFGELLPGLYVLAWSLVPRTIAHVAIASTKAMMHMEHDALLLGFLHPLLMLGGCFVNYAIGGGITGLLSIQLVVDTLVCGLALEAASRYYSFSELGAALRHFEFDRKLLGFSIPQSFNLTFNRYIARLDGIMLASFGLSQSELGYFGTAALLTSNIAQIRLVFSAALAPVIVRHHTLGDRAAIREALSLVCRWTTALAVPAILAALVLRKDILHLVSHEYGENSTFVALLLIPPFTSCAYGMAGACLMFTGHSRVTLANSFCVAILNTGFTYLLIPRFGMTGAALATAMATTMTSALQMIELQKIEGISIAWSAVKKPHLGLVAGLAVLALLWDPVSLPLAGRIATALGVTGGYALLMLLLGQEDALMLARRFLGRAKATS